MNGAQMAVLKTLLAGSHPDATAYSGLDDAAAAAKLNESSIAVKVPIPSTELLAWSAQSDRYKNIKAAADAPANSSHGIAAVALIMITRSDTTLDLNLPDRAAMVDALVSGGTLTAADKTSLEDMAASTVSHAEQQGLPVVSVGHVQRARV